LASRTKRGGDDERNPEETVSSAPFLAAEQAPRWVAEVDVCCEVLAKEQRMDDRTLGAYDLAAGAFAEEWLGQPVPVDLQAVVRKYFRPGPTADIGCGAGRDTAWLNDNGFPTVGYEPSSGLLGEAIVQPVGRFRSDGFITLGGRIPAPLQALGTSQTSAATATVLASTSPLWIALLAPVFIPRCGQNVAGRSPTNHARC